MDISTFLTALGGFFVGAVGAIGGLLTVVQKNRESVSAAEGRLRAELREDLNRTSARLDEISSRHWQLVDMVRRCPVRSCPLIDDIRKIDRRAPREDGENDHN